MKYDVITMGETMLRLSPTNNRRLEQLTALDVEISGSESSTAVGLARLGLKTAWVSRLPDSSLGRLVAGTIAHYGVDTSQVIWSDKGRVGLFFIDKGVAPRPTQVIYDRADSAFANFMPNEISETLFQPETAKLFHTSGICLAVGENAQQATYEAVAQAKAAKMMVSFDINHRNNLWTSEDARVACEPILQKTDLIFSAFRDVCLYYGYSSNDNPAEIIDDWAKNYPKATIVFTLGSKGSISRDQDGKIYQQSIFEAVEVDRFGGGDAFSAGFISQWLKTPQDLSLALRWGAATSAHKYTIPGDLPLFDRRDIEHMLNSDSDQGVVR